MVAMGCKLITIIILILVNIVGQSMKFYSNALSVCLAFASNKLFDYHILKVWIIFIQQYAD